ncbi:DinB family protein [Arthrobacter sp. STN4]|uniref:DinB family protein n=1 Tax=Arthrobacter sp. STN4 TaxID=2923276 RepID=UPI00211A4276|nr:DinB family protein [Arthrobacter sp. STN4]MCQ9164184.1 DinB family protein [Arthrobacter sp. STN4]
MTVSEQFERSVILDGYNRVQSDLRRILEHASTADLRRKSAGTKWTNEQLLFHMVFGFVIVAALRNLIRTVTILPPVFGCTLARVLNAGTIPFDWVNYLGSRYAALVFNRQRMAGKLERVLASLARHLTAEDQETLERSMAFPARWDPFFKETMSLLQTYQYPINHYDFHRKQLSLNNLQ